MQLSLASVFSDHMVLQQADRVPIWGRATAGSEVTVTFRGQTARSTADANGRWRVVLGPMQASARGEQLVVTARGQDGSQNQLRIADVLVGEVWICSGQSNMQWTLANSNDASQEIASSDLPLIRLLDVPRRTAREPEPEIDNARWQLCSPETSPPFSAVGYFFGRELHRRLGVPVGLIGASWGGTVAQAWTSSQGLESHPETSEILRKFATDLPTLAQRHAQWKQECLTIDQRGQDRENLGHPRGWAGDVEADAQWTDMLLPGTWQSRGFKFSGVVWFRKVVDVPASWAGRDLTLSIGATDKSDTTYFNNVKVGSLSIAERDDAWAVPRVYKVPGQLVKPGRNVIAVRVHSDKFAGGMTGPADLMSLAPAADATQKPIPLAGAWRTAVEANYGLVAYPAEPMGPDNPNAPTALFNGMIAPLVGYAVRGAIWYQGESNASQPRQYRTLFQIMIQDWRRLWGKPLAFHFVQLANYMAVDEHPSESNWALLREAQAMALQLENTGMAVAIDIGEASDIHPRNKQDVGLRLALSALHRTYGMQDIVPSGPTFRRMERQGNQLRIWFDHVGGGLQCHGDQLKGFAVAGADKRFVWADARIDGDTVLVSSPQVSEPAAVRYAWADNPVCNLYSAANLPAAPFRSDVD